MRFHYDPDKSRTVKKKHAVALDEAQEIFDRAHMVDQRSDPPEQFGSIGWSRGSVIFERRLDRKGEYFHLITVWKATAEEERNDAENI